MTDASEGRADLSALEEDTALGATRVMARVNRRISAERDLWGGVRLRLARFAIPAVIAAAASLAAIVLGRVKAPAPDHFAQVVMGEGPAARWVSENRRPDIAELVALAAPVR